MIELITAAEAGIFIAFSVTVIGIGMAIRKRAIRNKQKRIEQDVRQSEQIGKLTRKETHEPEPQETQSPSTETPTENIDTDALLDSLKDDTEQQKSD
ncbi:uncharacterized protein METZ01_LOCUS91930 [marine metagenome]|uniref:Uncharacterized protein n=1 Tax=marine metagenome TaxID=408172 RepID=A0A381VFD4_9ZZZZ|tara:strand:- start:2732 stop:3022 length:291 start_codon:yes stop_codon:yes gene_type:complete